MLSIHALPSLHAIAKEPRCGAVAPPALKYCTDGYLGYIGVVYPGQHARNIHNKNDTFTVEGVSADLRHYLPVLARRVRCFCRQLETLIAVVKVFADAYNKFGDYKAKHRIPVIHKSPAPYKCLRKYSNCPLGLIDFLWQRCVGTPPKKVWTNSAFYDRIGA
jgi:hypothetical protein